MQCVRMKGNEKPCAPFLITFYFLRHKLYYIFVSFEIGTKSRKPFHYMKTTQFFENPEHGFAQ